jgi:hypothetical protein
MVLSASSAALLGRLLLDQYEAIHEMKYRNNKYLLIEYDYKQNKITEKV